MPNPQECIRQGVLSCAAIVLCVAAVLPLPTADAQIAVGSTVEEHIASPGEAYTGSILVRNVTTVPQVVRIYQEDYTFFADGTSHFDPPGSLARSNARWVMLSTRSITVPPSGEMTVGYTVQVPRADSLSGTYWSMIMVEGAPNAPIAPAKGQFAIGSIIRYGIQVATHLGNSGSRKIEFAKQRLVATPAGLDSLEFVVTNVGERGYRPLLWMEVYDDRGVVRQKLEQQRGLIYPGTSVKQAFAVGHLPHGNYKALVFADTGDDAVFAAQYKLHF